MTISLRRIAELPAISHPWRGVDDDRFRDETVRVGVTLQYEHSLNSFFKMARFDAFQSGEGHLRRNLLFVNWRGQY